MISIGLEGTAEKTGVGIVDSSGNVLFNKTIIYKPPVQGINPREAADHHAETFPKLIKEAFEVVPKEDIDLVSFSQGPGLGPSLRVCATTARALSLSLKKPIIGVNHCIGHVEIGKLTTGAKDPLTLYVSGGNTQILGYSCGRYRVFGETLDIAIGNCLDQFARNCGLPHPGGVYVEKLANEGIEVINEDNAKNENNANKDNNDNNNINNNTDNIDNNTSNINNVNNINNTNNINNRYIACNSSTENDKRSRKLIKLPYSVKGMDITFSGLLTSAIKSYERGERLEDVCYSLQETAFSMITEITERAIAHTNKSEVMLVGGVAANNRLREMLNIMCQEQNVKFYVPEKQFCGDNGAMIAWLGILMYKNGKRMKIEETRPIPNYRSDMVDVNWIDDCKDDCNVEKRIIPKHLIGKGAEADIKKTSYLGWDSIVKERVAKNYRVKELDTYIRERRTVRESKFLALIKDLGISAPYIFDIDRYNNTITMSYILGKLAKEEIDGGNLHCCKEIGRIIGILHKNNIIHNDLTTSNFIVEGYYDKRSIDKTIEDRNIRDMGLHKTGKNIVEFGKNNIKSEENTKIHKVHIIDFGLGKFSNLIEDKAVDLIVLKKSILSIHYDKFEEIWNQIIEGYKIYPEWKQVINHIGNVEQRARYF